MGDCREKTPGRVILATERLILREMTEEDLPALRSMLQDIEVMYAWEHAFSEEEVRQWLARMRWHTTCQPRKQPRPSRR